MIGAPLATIELGIMSGSTVLVVDSSRIGSRFAAVAIAGLAMVGLSGAADASEMELSGAVTVAGPSAPGGVVAAGASAPAGEENLIPPNVQGAAVPAAGGGYCYGGPHPAPGGGWEAVTTPHTHEYAP